MMDKISPTVIPQASWASALLRPRAVALVGSSDDPAKTAGRPLHFLRRAGFQHSVYPVNPRRGTVQGEKAYESLSALPERPDHVFILTGTELALDTLEECGRLGIPVATILAGGFSEAGQQGIDNQKRLEDIRSRYAIRILGPSSIGLANLHHDFVLTANAAFAEPDLSRGGLFVGSHSGSLIGALASRGKARGIGFAGLVSVGGESDLSIGEICAATLDDPAVTGYLLFLESINHAHSLRAFAVEAAKRGKPIAAYKLGRTAAAAELSVSHTGALAGADDVADMFLQECGIARLEAFDGLLEVSALLERIPAENRKRPARVGVVTTTGGGAAMAVDQIALRGVEVVAPSLETRTRLAQAGVDAHSGRIVDLTLAGTRYEIMKASLDILLSAPEFDLVLATVGSSARFNPDLAVMPIIDAAREHSGPLAAYIVPDAPEAIRALAGAGVPVFGTPEICGDAIASAFRRRPPRLGVSRSADLPNHDHMLDEAQAYAFLGSAGISHAPYVILDPGTEVPDLDFAYPVVAKVLHKDIAHKSDVGGVVLNIADAAELSKAMTRIRAAVATYRAGTIVDRILVQPMTRGMGEVLVGIRRDPHAGPLVMVAAGGVATEIYRDSSLRLAPVDIATAHEMIGEVRACQLLKGFRGAPEGDIDALARTIVALSELAMRDNPAVIEAEINPLLVLPRGKGVVAVDGLFRVAEEERP